MEPSGVREGIPGIFLPLFRTDMRMLRNMHAVQDVPEMLPRPTRGKGGSVMHDLLTDPLIGTSLNDGSQAALTLPGYLAAAMRDGIADTTSLRSHQRAPWHMVLAQIGAIALDRAGRADPPEEEGAWRDLIAALTPEFPGNEPWSLVVADPALPAFLQPPVPPAAPALKPLAETPDALDLLVTSKNFDVKRATARAADPDAWLFALVSLQTMEGFLGAGNYGIARMNGGFSSRPFLGLAPARGGFGAHLRRDIVAMLGARAKLLDRHEHYAEEGGRALIWLTPWSGTASLPLEGLDPFFIEICRRVRLRMAEGRLIAEGGNSKVARIDAKAMAGNTGDFWAPLDLRGGGDPKGYTLDAGGFGYRRLNRLLFATAKGERLFADSPAMRSTDAERGTPMRLVARGLVRGQGKTEGFHERILPLKREFAVALFGGERDRVGTLAATQIGEIEAIAKALRFACAIVSCGASEGGPGKSDYDAAKPFSERLDHRADALFFGALQERLIGTPGADTGFRRALYETAEALLKEAAETVPCTARLRPKARVAASRTYRGMIRKVFPDLLEKETADVR